MYREYIRDEVAAKIEEIIDQFGEIRSHDIHKELMKSGYSKNTINRAATLANVTSFKKPGENCNWWRIGSSSYS